MNDELKKYCLLFIVHRSYFILALPPTISRRARRARLYIHGRVPSPRVRPPHRPPPRGPPPPPRAAPPARAFPFMAACPRLAFGLRIARTLGASHVAPRSHQFVDE